MSECEIHPINPSQIRETVLMWRRSRDHVQPLLEARMEYSANDDLSFFTNVLLKTCDVWIATRDAPDARDAHALGLLAIEGTSIEQLYVDPAEQTKGIGSRLLDFAKHRLPGGLCLRTHQSNSRAIRFYERRGFRAVEFGISASPEREPDVQFVWDGMLP